MESLNKIKNSLAFASGNNIPPIDKWNPLLSGNIDIVIKTNGDWYHDGIKFTRQPLIKLFSSILKKEDNDYYLVTPIEKWRITVECAPLIVAQMEATDTNDANQKIQFKTSTDDIFYLNDDHPLQISYDSFGEIKPLVRVRSNLDALIHRNIFYQLADMAKNVNGAWGVWSDGVFFKLE